MVDNKNCTADKLKGKLNVFKMLLLDITATPAEPYHNTIRHHTGVLFHGTSASIFSIFNSVDICSCVF
jgi:hypothetical protein